MADELKDDAGNTKLSAQIYFDEEYVDILYRTFLNRNADAAGKADWLVRSNVEAGEGFADIIVETDDLDAGVIVELKYAQTMTAMEKSCAKALAQIRAKRYADYLHNNGREKVLLYGIAFCKKRCRVVAEKL